MTLSDSFAEASPKKPFGEIYLPLHVHIRAQLAQTLVIVGSKGSGKSALFRFLVESHQLRRGRHAIDAFSSKNVEIDTLALTSPGADFEAMRGFWRIHLLRQLTASLQEELLADIGPGAKQAIEAHPAEWRSVPVAAHLEIAAAFDRLDRRLEERGESVDCAYDQLDLLAGFDAEHRSQWIAALLAFWIHLTYRHSHLRPKIFLREDLYKASLGLVPDAGKLSNSVVSLEWSFEDLFRLVIRYMSAQKGLRDWLTAIPEIPWQDTVVGRIPGSLDEEVLKHFLLRLTGKEIMGQHYTKGFVSRWIPQHIKDGHGKIVPRTILNLFGLAAKIASERTASKATVAEDSPLIDTQDILEALKETSSRRVLELREELPVAEELEKLRGKTMLMPLAEASGLLGGERIVEELVDLGILIRRDGARIDVPDIYRYGFEIKRSGGAAKA